MIILFAPAKTLKNAPKVEVINHHFPYEQITKDIVNHIQSLNPLSLKKALHISDAQVSTIYLLYHHFDTQPYHFAYDLLDGVAYRALDYQNLSSKAQNYIHQYVYVIDALYGVFQMNTLIKPYYLDMSYKGMNLRSVWRPILHDWLVSQNSGKQEILSLTSIEYSDLISKNIPFYRVNFLNHQNGKLKAISVFSKQMRGKLLRYIAENHVEKVCDLPTTIEGYELVKDGYELTYLKQP